jgi:ubiquinone/menaquinone biosynthesis C-methylase UbiE
MKRSALFHPRVFHEQEWAEGYYKRNKGSIKKVGQRLSGLLKTMGFNEGTVLDVGCGFATVPIEIARAFPKTKITGIDLGEPLLEIGRTLIRNEGMENQITLLNGDALNLQYEDSSFDLVINSFLLHILEDPVQMLNEIERVTKPGGTILITDLRRGLLAYFIKKFRTAHTLEEASEIVGKSKIRSGKFSSGPFWWDYVADHSTRR